MSRGGKRKGAGRPKGSGKYGESTKAVRLPISMIEEIKEFIQDKLQERLEQKNVVGTKREKTAR